MFQKGVLLFSEPGGDVEEDRGRAVRPGELNAVVLSAVRPQQRLGARLAAGKMLANIGVFGADALRLMLDARQHDRGFDRVAGCGRLRLSGAKQRSQYCSEAPGRDAWSRSP